MNKKNLSCDVLLNKTSFNHFQLIMRITIILLFTSIFITFAETGYAQNAHVTVNKKSVSIKEVLNEIENQTDYLFIFNNKVDISKTVSVNSRDEAVNMVLKKVLKDSNIDFSFEGNHIILTYIENKKNNEDTSSSKVVKQQEKTISGNIVDSKGEPIIGANIIEKGTTNGTITDYDGNFILKVNDSAVLKISYIGYLEQEIITKDKNSIKVVLLEDSQALDEVVVVGYGTMKKRDVTTAIASLKSSDLQDKPVSSIAEAMVGRMPGV